MSSDNHIHLPVDSKFSNAIRDEARRFELKITDGGQLTFGAERTSNDDLSWRCVMSYSTVSDHLRTGVESVGFRSAAFG